MIIIILLCVCSTDVLYGGSGGGLSCDHPGDLEHGYILGSDYSIGSHLTYVCHEGYILVGPKTRVCQPDGTYGGAKPLCKRDGKLLDCVLI